MPHAITELMKSQENLNFNILEVFRKREAFSEANKWDLNFLFDSKEMTLL